VQPQPPQQQQQQVQGLQYAHQLGQNLQGAQGSAQGGGCYQSEIDMNRIYVRNAKQQNPTGPAQTPFDVRSIEGGANQNF
jgi:hypothetical protein